MQKVDQLSFLKKMVNDRIIKESKLNTFKCNIREATAGTRNNSMLDIQNKIGLDDTVEQIVEDLYKNQERSKYSFIARYNNQILKDMDHLEVEINEKRKSIVPQKQANPLF